MLFHEWFGIIRIEEKFFARVSKAGPGYRRSVFLPVIVRVDWAIGLVLSHRANFVCVILCSAALFSHHGGCMSQDIVKYIR